MEGGREAVSWRNDKPPRNYGLTLHYKLKALVASIAAVEADMKQITRAVLAELSRQGRKPPEKWVLLEEFMQPLGLSANALALALRVPATRIGDIIRTEKPGSVSADTALRLGALFRHQPRVLAEPAIGIRSLARYRRAWRVDQTRRAAP